MLEIKTLRVHYGKAEALKGISLSMDEGAIVALIGANGAGKTTTLRTISGLKMPTSGEIWLKGKKINGLPVHDIVKLGIAHIPEGRIVFAPMTVFDNLRMGAYLRKDKHEIIKDLEAMYEHFPILKKRQWQLAGRLSGGEQQMLAIARALMARPKLLLMDEPSMGLSPLLVEEVANIISSINKSNISVMLVEQNARMALELANKAYILEVGNITLEGDAKELANHEQVKKAYLGG
ncbi:MAG: ABC transporter ATP-binding protein [Thermodesulfobacteriota bacterium]|jgi:branched-chain amino acid transport system ATP-binding protein